MEATSSRWLAFFVPWLFLLWGAFVERKNLDFLKALKLLAECAERLDGGPDSDWLEEIIYPFINEHTEIKLVLRKPKQ